MFKVPKSLALNMIVGPNEAFELNRCLESFSDLKIFDEIIIGVTTKDEEVIKVAKAFATKVINIPWEDNFSKARNAVLDATESDFIMWMDADDVLDKTSSQRFARIKTEVLGTNEHDFYFMKYNLDDMASIQRERIFKRKDSIRWKYPIHEQLTVSISKSPHTFINGVSINHRSTKIGAQSAHRNIRIAEEVLATYPDDNRIQFHLAQDFIQIGEFKKADKLIRALLLKDTYNREQLASLCSRYALKKLYRKGAKSLMEIDPECIRECASYAKTSIQQCDKFAEPYVLLGDLAGFEGKPASAIKCFRTALGMPYGSFGVQGLQYYQEIPAFRLALIYAENEDLEETIYYCKLALQCLPDNEILLETKGNAIKSLIKRYAPMMETEMQPA